MIPILSDNKNFQFIVLYTQGMIQMWHTKLYFGIHCLNTDVTHSNEYVEVVSINEYQKNNCIF